MVTDVKIGSSCFQLLTENALLPILVTCVPISHLVQVGSLYAEVSFPTTSSSLIRVSPSYHRVNGEGGKTFFTFTLPSSLSTTQSFSGTAPPPKRVKFY